MKVSVLKIQKVRFLWLNFKSYIPGMNSTFSTNNFKGFIFVCCLLIGSTEGFSQKQISDSAINTNIEEELTDFENIDLEELFSDISLFLDSLMKPRSYFLASVAVAGGKYDFAGRNDMLIESSQKMTFIPTIGYLHKGGLGITGMANVIFDQKELLPYQFSITPSYDYIQNMDFATGISYTRYFTKDSLSFYTTPLHNEIFGYFSYRKWWLRPSVSVSYGWGNRTEFEEREYLLNNLRSPRRGYTTISSNESVSDFSVITSVRHDFYWLKVLTGKDYVRFSPQINFTSGTQRFGFNQSYNAYIFPGKKGNGNPQSSSDSIELEEELEFQPVSLSLHLRGEYSIGKMFLQPSFLLGYYFAYAEKPIHTLFSLNAGVVF